MLGANISKDTRRRVYRRDGYRCALCDDPRRLQIHHVIFRSQGGLETEQNLITLCPRCHALCHGTDIDRLGKSMEEMAQYCIEYLSDIYACEGIIWNPWSKEEVNWKW